MLFLWLWLSLVVSLEADETESPQTFCGRALADARMLYCMSEETAQSKREVPDLLRENEMYQEKRLFPFDSADASGPWRASYDVTLRTRSKRLAGIVDECCFKPCYLSELRSYC